MEYIVYYLITGFIFWTIIASLEFYELYKDKYMYENPLDEVKYRLSFSDYVSWKAVIHGFFMITLLWVWTVPFYFLQDKL